MVGQRPKYATCARSAKGESPSAKNTYLFQSFFPKANRLLSSSSINPHFSALNSECVVLGYLNVDLLTLSSTLFSPLNQVSRQFGFTQLIMEATGVVASRISTSSTLLDHVYVNTPALYNSFGQFPSFGSEHFRVFTATWLCAQWYASVWIFKVKVGLLE